MINYDDRSGKRPMDINKLCEKEDGKREKPKKKEKAEKYNDEDDDD